MSTKHIDKLRKLNDSTDPNAFAKTPKGYALRERAALVQLGMHKSVAVRTAVAKLPILRDMFIILMYDNETNKDIQKILRPRYELALSKSEQRKNELEIVKHDNSSMKAIIKELKARLNINK